MAAACAKEVLELITTLAEILTSGSSPPSSGDDRLLGDPAGSDPTAFRPEPAEGPPGLKRSF